MTTNSHTRITTKSEVEFRRQRICDFVEAHKDKLAVRSYSERNGVLVLTGSMKNGFARTVVFIPSMKAKIHTPDGKVLSYDCKHPDRLFEILQRFYKKPQPRFWGWLHSFFFEI